MSIYNRNLPWRNTDKYNYTLIQKAYESGKSIRHIAKFTRSDRKTISKMVKHFRWTKNEKPKNQSPMDNFCDFFDQTDDVRPEDGEGLDLEFIQKLKEEFHNAQ